MSTTPVYVPPQARFSRGRGQPAQSPPSTAPASSGSGSGTRGSGGRGGGGISRGDGYYQNPNIPNLPSWRGHRKFDDRIRLESKDIPKGPVLVELTRKDLDVPGEGEGEGEGKAEGEGILRKEGYELLASYNWVAKEGGPAIIVPGMPPRWTPPSLPAWLTPDTGVFFIDQNGHRSPHSPFTPALHALFTLHPTFDPNPLDIITDCNSLRKLFRFITTRGDAAAIDKEFKIYAEAINNTVVFTRWEKETLEADTGAFRGFGHTFEQKFTKLARGMEGTTGHNRVCRYRFGGLELLVRFSADAFLRSRDLPEGSGGVQGESASPMGAGGEKEGKAESGAGSAPEAGEKAGKESMGLAGGELKQQKSSTATKSTQSEDEDEESPTASPRVQPTSPTTSPSSTSLIDSPIIDSPDDLADLFGNSLNLLPSSPTPPAADPTSTSPPASLPLEIIPGGTLMPQSRILEIKTRSASRFIDLTDQIPQLWFTHTQHLYVGYHHRGQFNMVDTKVMDPEALVRWEEAPETQRQLRMLRGLLGRIVEAVRGLRGGGGGEGGRAQVVCVGRSVRVYKVGEGGDRQARGGLPAELRRRWGGGEKTLVEF